METNELVQIISASIIISGLLLYLILAIIGRKKIIKDGWTAWYFSLGTSKKDKEDV